MTQIRTVGDLITALQAFKPELPVELIIDNYQHREIEEFDVKQLGTSKKPPAIVQLCTYGP